MPYQQWHAKTNDLRYQNKLNGYIKRELFDLTWWSTGDIIAKSLNLINSDEIKLLDIGSGWGRVIHSLKYNFKNIQVCGVELTRELSEMSRKVLSKFDNVVIENADFLNLDIPTDYFTHAISIRVIHYLCEEEKKKFISKLWDSTKIGGKIFIAVPNLFCPIRWFTYKHAPLYSGLKLKKLVESQGFKVNCIGSYNFFPPRIRFSHESPIKYIELFSRRIPIVKYIGGLWFVQGQRI